MDADDLRILDAVASNGSMSRAAAQLHMVQSNITARVRLLEEELGVQLFVRHSRGVEPNEACRRLLSYSDRIHGLFREAIAAAKENGTPVGSLRVGTMETTANMRLPDLVAKYANAYPAVELKVVAGPSASLIDDVVKQRLDGAFVAGPVHRRDLGEEPVFRERLALVSPASIRSLDDLRQIHNLKIVVFREGCHYRRLLGDLLERLAVRYQVMEFGSLHAIVSCVASNVGVTVLPEAAVDRLQRDYSISAHPLPPDVAEVETVFIRRIDRRPTSALDAFLKMTRLMAKDRLTNHVQPAID